MPRSGLTTVTIANGQSLSGEVDLGNNEVVAIVMPATFTAADLTFQGSATSGGTFQNVYDDADGELTCQAAQARVIVPTAAILRALSGLRFVKVRSGTAGSPVAQGGDRTITLVTRRRPS